jgi:hypothetical protein
MERDQRKDIFIVYIVVLALKLGPLQSFKLIFKNEVRYIELRRQKLI